MNVSTREDAEKICIVLGKQHGYDFEFERGLLKYNYKENQSVNFAFYVEYTPRYKKYTFEAKIRVTNRQMGIGGTSKDDIQELQKMARDIEKACQFALEFNSLDITWIETY